jgi:hypothetical protein
MAGIQGSIVVTEDFHHHQAGDYDTSNMQDFRLSQQL